MLSLLESLGIPASPGVTAIVGGGGKTTLMFRLAEELASRGAIAVAITTTRIYPPEDPEICLLCGREDLSDLMERGRVYCIGAPGMDGKLHYPGDEAFAAARQSAHRLFVEADGAKHCPAKAPGENEPVIPPNVDNFIAVAGLDAPGGKIADVCFRSELVCEILGAKPEDILSTEMLAELILSERGQRKALPEGVPFTVVLNKADSPERTAAGEATAKRIKELCPSCRVLLTALAQRDCVRAIY